MASNEDGEINEASDRCIDFNQMAKDARCTRPRVIARPAKQPVSA